MAVAVEALEKPGLIEPEQKVDSEPELDNIELYRKYGSSDFKTHIIEQHLRGMNVLGTNVAGYFRVDNKQVWFINEFFMRGEHPGRGEIKRSPITGKEETIARFGDLVSASLLLEWRGKENGYPGNVELLNSYLDDFK